MLWMMGAVLDFGFLAPLVAAVPWLWGVLFGVVRPEKIGFPGIFSDVRTLTDILLYSTPLPVSTLVQSMFPWSVPTPLNLKECHIKIITNRFLSSRQWNLCRSSFVGAAVRKKECSLSGSKCRCRLRLLRAIGLAATRAYIRLRLLLVEGARMGLLILVSRCVCCLARSPRQALWMLLLKRSHYLRSTSSSRHDRNLPHGHHAETVIETVFKGRSTTVPSSRTSLPCSRTWQPVRRT